MLSLAALEHDITARALLKHVTSCRMHESKYICDLINEI